MRSRKEQTCAPAWGSEQQKAVRELQTFGKVSLLAVDMSDPKSIATAASKSVSIGQLDLLINNAGIYPDEGVSVLTISREQVVSTFLTNTLVQILTGSGCVGLLRRPQ